MIKMQEEKTLCETILKELIPRNNISTIWNKTFQSEEKHIDQEGLVIVSFKTKKPRGLFWFLKEPIQLGSLEGIQDALLAKYNEIGQPAVLKSDYQPEKVIRLTYEKSLGEATISIPGREQRKIGMYDRVIISDDARLITNFGFNSLEGKYSKKP